MSIHSGTTLVHGNSFQWSFDTIKGLVISREFKNSHREDQFSVLEIEKLLQFTFSKGEVLLGNSVSKMNDGTEIDGLGAFVYDNIKADNTFAQSVSQFAAIMVDAEIFSSRKESRWMKCKLKNIDWQTRLLNYK